MVAAAEPGVEAAPPAAATPAAPPPGAPAPAGGSVPADATSAPAAIPAPPAIAPPSATVPTPTTPVPVEPPPPPGTEGTPRAGELAKPDAEPDSIIEVGVQRLPAYAYPSPQTRGLPFGSLWLTFHGLQWPYMPALSKDQRFVVGVSGFGWLDTAYQKFGPWGMGLESTLAQNRIKYLKGQGRFLLRLTPTYAFRDGLFIQGQVELIGTLDQTGQRSDLGSADTDDLFLRVGKWNSWDFQVGRFEGWEVFHLGMGLDQNTFERQGAVGPGLGNYGISFYGLTDNQFRPAGPAVNGAVHYYPLKFLRFELLGTAGTLNGNNTYATRPVGVLDFGWVKLKGGVEYQRQLAQPVGSPLDITSKGVGGALQFVLLPYVEFGINAAQGTVEGIDSMGRADLRGSFTRTSFGAFLNVSNGNLRHPVLFGIGSLLSTKEDQDNTIVLNRVNEYWLYQGYAAAQYVLRGQFFIKLVGSFSRGHWDTNDPAIVFDNEMYSVRLRFAYLF
jgi:hypothetical protein